MRLSATKSLLERRDVVIVASVSAIYGIGYTASLSFSLLPSRPTQETAPDAFVIKADAARNVIWATRIGSGNQDYGMNLAVGNDGFIYVTGFSGDSNATSPARGFLSKLKASDGIVVYTRMIGDTIAGNSYGEDLSIGIDGSVYVAISTDGNLGGNINLGNRDVAVQKYDQNGTLIWTVLQGTAAKEEARTIATGPDGSVYLTGHTSGNLGGQINYGGEDAFITKISQDGIIEWTKLLGTAGNDVGWAVTTAGHNSLIVSGLTNGNLEGRTSKGGQDIFIASLDISAPAAATSVAVILNRTSVREQDQERLLFSFSRTGSLLEPLSIRYSLSGNASQADYSGAVPGADQRFILPAGVHSADLTLSPVVDDLVEGDESIVLSLSPDTTYSIATAAPLKATLIGELNHEPIATFGAKLSARVGAATLKGKLSSTDQESGDQAYFQLLRSAPAGFALQENGNWSFNPQDPQVLSIAAGERRSSSVVYRVEDRVPSSQPSPPRTRCGLVAPTPNSPPSRRPWIRQPPERCCY
jgi:VCBS repeat-containing protein